MKKYLWLSGVMAFLISGCTAVSSVNPVGSKPVNLDPEKWDGVWSDGNKQIYYVKVKDADKGILHVGSVDEKDGKFILKTFDAEVKVSDKEKFCNIKVMQVLDEKDKKNSPDKVKESYYWMLINNQKGKITLILPHAEKIEKLAKEGKLKAEKVEDTVMLDGSTAEVTESIQSFNNGELYIWKYPLTLIRIMGK